MNKFLAYLSGDKVIWIIAIMILLLSIVSVYSFIPVLINKEGESYFHYLFKHSIHVVFGLVVMIIIHFANPNIFSKLSKLGYYIAIILLLYTLFFGIKVNDAGRWIRIPLIGTFQSSDFAKVAIIIYISRLLEKGEDVINQFREGFLKIVFPLLFVCSLIFKDNFSTSMIVLFVGLLLMYIGKTPLKFIVGLLALFLIIGTTAIFIQEYTNADFMPNRYHTWKNRIEINFNRNNKDTYNPLNDMQATNAKLAIANGKILPIDLHNGNLTIGNGKMKYYVAEAYADFYFASFIEEFGLVFGILLILIYLILLYRIFKIGLNTKRKFQTYVCLGFGILMLTQTVVNMAVSTSLVPVTGQNIPLLGMGGSSMLMSCVMLGIILSISAENKKDKTPNKIEVVEES